MLVVSKSLPASGDGDGDDLGAELAVEPLNGDANFPLTWDKLTKPGAACEDGGLGAIPAPSGRVTAGRWDVEGTTSSSEQAVCGAEAAGAAMRGLWVGGGVEGMWRSSACLGRLSLGTWWPV